MTRIALFLGLLVMAVACSAAAAERVAVTASESAPTSSVPATTTTSLPAITATTAAPDSTTAPSLASTMTTTAAPEPDPGFPQPTPGVADRWVPEVLAEYPHDATAFTQGLVMVGGSLFESTGLYGRSSIREVAITTGDVLNAEQLSPDLFGEGLALVDDRLIQLTWQEGTAIVWTPGLGEIDRFAYQGEGWGLCDDGARLIMSDGSATLEFRDRSTFAPTGEVAVTLSGVPVAELNELECVAGLVFANVWRTTNIVVIDPGSGDVTAVIDAAALDEWSAGDSSAVLNGIAYDGERGVFYVTGKLWPTLYEVVFVAG